MVTRPPTDLQILDLKNAGSATAWIISFVVKCRSEKKEDRIDTDSTIQDRQLTNCFLSMCEQDANIKCNSWKDAWKVLEIW